MCVCLYMCMGMSVYLSLEQYFIHKHFPPFSAGQKHAPSHGMSHTHTQFQGMRRLARLSSIDAPHWALLTSSDFSIAEVQLHFSM